MNPLVRDLYKRLIIAGRSHPQGITYIREKVKVGFFGNKHLVNEIDVKRAIAKGRYMARELQSFTQFHKYRMMRKRYNDK